MRSKEGSPLKSARGHQHGGDIKPVVKLLYRHGVPQATIARDYGLSRQRVHQIIRGYDNRLSTGRAKRYLWAIELEKELFQRSGGVCERCNGRAGRLIHHRNCNEGDHRLKNLNYLCPTCHYKIHTAKRETTRLQEELEHQKELIKTWFDVPLAF